MGGHVGGHFADQLQAFLHGLVGNHIGHVGQDTVQVKGDVLHTELARFDLGEVQDVVDDAQQVLA